jgi:hypothetical protein
MISRGLYPGMILLLSLGLPFGRLRAQQPPARTLRMSRDEYAVLGAVLERVHMRSSKQWVLVASSTATFACNPPVENGASLGGCSGMRIADESPEQRLSSVRSAIPKVSAQLAADFLMKNQQSVILSRALPASVRQWLWMPGTNGASPFAGDQELAFYPSRVGFNAAHTEALAYCGVMHQTDISKSVGRYFYLKEARGHWVIVGQTDVWALAGGRPN